MPVANFHLLQTQCQTEFLIQQLNHERAIRRTASQSGTRGDVLEQVDVNGRYIMILFQQFVGSDHEVVFRLSFDGRTFHVKRIRSIVIFSSCHFQCILQVDGVENGFQVVVTVGTFFNSNIAESFEKIGIHGKNRIFAPLKQKQNGRTEKKYTCGKDG